MFSSHRKKVLGTKYSISANMDPRNEEMRIVLFFEDRRDSSAIIENINDIQKKLERLLSGKRYLDVEGILETFIPFLKTEFYRFQNRLKKMDGRKDSKIGEVDNKVLQEILQRLNHLEGLMENFEPRIKKIESIIITKKSSQFSIDLEPQKVSEVSRTPSEIEQSLQVPPISRPKPIRIEIAESLRKEGKIIEYIEALKAILKQNKEDIEILNQLGNAYLKKRDYALAGDTFKESLKNNDNNSIALLGLAKVTYHTRRSQLSLDFLEKAKKIDPDSEEIWTLLSMVYEALGDSDKSLDCLEKASELGRSKMSQKSLAKVDSSSVSREAPPIKKTSVITVSKMEKSTDTEVKKAITPVEKIDLSDVQEQSSLLKGEGEIVSEDKTRESIQNKSPEEVQALYDLTVTRGNTYYKSGKLEEALKTYNMAANLKPDVLRAWNNIGIISETLGYKKKAKNAFKKALSVCEEQGDARGKIKYKKWLAVL